MSEPRQVHEWEELVEHIAKLVRVHATMPQHVLVQGQTGFTITAVTIGVNLNIAISSTRSVTCGGKFSANE